MLLKHPFFSLRNSDILSSEIFHNFSHKTFDQKKSTLYSIHETFLKDKFSILMKNRLRREMSEGT